MNAPECNVQSEARILTQEEVNEQIRSYIAHPTIHQEDLTWLIQGRSTAQHPNNDPRAGTSASRPDSFADPTNIKKTEYEKLTQLFLVQSGTRILVFVV